MGREYHAAYPPVMAAPLPTDWGWKQLDAVCDGIFDCPHSTPALAEHGPYIARSQDIRSGVFRTEVAGRVAEETYRERIVRAEPRHGDLLYSREGTYFGIAAEVPSNVQLCLGQRMVLLRPDPSTADFRFLRYWLNSPIMTAYVNGHRDGTVAERLNLPTIRTLPVALPPLPEQRAIAHILGSLDDKIELNRQMNATLEAMARALFKSWFVDFDPVRAKLALSGVEGANGDPYPLDAETLALFPDRFVDSALGEVPEGWKVRSLDNIAYFQNGLALQNYPPGDETFLPVLKIRELRQGGFDDQSDKASLDIAETCIVSDGDVLFSWSGSLLVDVWCGGKGALNQHLFKVTSSECPKWFYYFWTKYHLTGFQRIAADKATTMGHIKRHHLAEALVVIPSPAVMQAATEQIAPLQNLVMTNNLQSRTLTELRDGLLPKLISGELRVPEVLETMEAVTP